jgi:hypothetical protein
MIERLARALEHVEELPVDAQEDLAEQIESYRRAGTAGLSGLPNTRRNFAGIWRDLPDDMEETLLRWRHQAVPTPPIEDQVRWTENGRR